MTTTFDRAFREDIPKSLWTDDLATVSPHATHLSFNGKVKGLDRLGTFDKLVSVHLREAGDAALQAVAQVRGLRELHLFYLRITDLAPLAALSQLEGLHVEACSKLTTLAPLTALASHLRELKVGDLDRVTDIGPLAALTGVRALGLTCGVLKQWKIDTLAPLATLTGLNELQLEGIVPADGDVRPVAQLKQLAELDLSPRLLALRDHARLVAALPGTRVRPAGPVQVVSAGYVNDRPDPEGPWLVPTGKGARTLRLADPKAAALRARREAEWAAWIHHYARHDPATDTAEAPAA